MGEMGEPASFTPERRDGPPWVMQEMIFGQPELPGQVAAHPDTRRLADLLRETSERAEPVLLAGCGTSEHAARAAAALVTAARSRSRAHGRDAFEVTLDPPGNGLLVGISHEGRTRATIDALGAARANGARTALITACPCNAPAGVQVIGTPRHDDSWCHTVAYTSPLLAVGLALELLTPALSRQIIVGELEALGQRQAEAAALGACARILIVASGVDEITAAELALKIEEATHVPATPLGIEKVLHGHLPAADASTGIALLRFDGARAAQRDGRAADVVAAAGPLACPVIALTPRHAVGNPAEALLAGALALQLLTLELAHARRTNPDLIRREEEPYRLAAGAGDG